MPRRRRRDLLHPVERTVALAALPVPYGDALRLADGGADDDAIAAAVHVPTDAVAALLEVGEGKLAALLDLSDDEGGPALG